MELSFNQEGSRWIAEFLATSDFNLHIERTKGGFLYMQQRTTGGGKFDSISDASFPSQDLIIDYDCTALIYPKYLKIVSESRPDYAAVISTGEVTEIKSQSKEIEVTSNGTTEVTPDSGFAYLSSVKVKTNVAQSGGNEGGADSSSKNFIQYFKVSKGWNRATFARMFGVILKAEANGNLSIYPSNMVNNTIDSSIVAYGIMPNLPISSPDTSAKNLKEYLDISQPMLFTQTEITEAEFYNLDVPEVEE